MTGQVSLYNPRTTPPEQLEAMLVGRDALLKEVLDNLREQARARTHQHWLLRGPRGMGKTHLTGIIHHRVKEDAELSRAYLPLWLGEADVYEVYSPATLLERIAERLVEARPDSELGASLRALEGVGDEEGLFQELVRLLSEEAKRQDQTLLVLMENLDALLEGFAPKERAAQLRQLRSLLLHDPHFLFISTTPTRYLAELTDPKKPLYNQFKERNLKPLTVEEVGTVFSKLAALTGRHGMEQVLGTGQDAALRQKVIHQLTGGLPRSVVMAFGVMQDKSGIQVLVEDLRKLLDAQTAYFEARLARLAPRERAIVTAMALASENLTLKEIASRSRLPEKTLSTLISRLVQDGHVEITVGTGGKGTVYGLSEGLFRLWYQYRKGRLLLEPLVRLLAYLFKPSELQDTISSLKQHLSVEGPERDSARLALQQTEEALRLATSEDGRRDRERLWSECLEDAKQSQAIAGYRRIIEQIQQSMATPLSESRGAGDIPYSNLITQVVDAAMVLPEPMARDCTESLMARLWLLINEDSQAGTAALTHLLHHLDGRNAPSLSGAVPLVHLALGMSLEQLGRYEEGLRHINEALRHSKGAPPNKFNIPLELGLWQRAILLEHLERVPEAVREYKEFIRQVMARTIDMPVAGFRAAHRLSSLCIRIEDDVGAEQALRSLVQLADGSELEENDRKILGYAKLLLVTLSMTRGELLPPQILASYEQWLRDFPTNDMNEDARRVYRILKPVAEAWTEENPRVAAETFLANPAGFYLFVEPSQLRQFLDELAKQLPPDLQAPLHVHHILADALSATLSSVLEEALKKPTSRSALKEILGRFPSELRQMVQEFMEQWSAIRNITSWSSESKGARRRHK
ncbi:AAA family ATPase [Pyxidicoccus caerfyrddinensis]|uniref:AAA family ATPase n=1 Tax=Pyxidicoccus caerfyrddinensis TaxID=2709663 RepID=UPI0013DB8176|nr:ATP-binding protein [Pyxidicoccus caerfyrddinensis]